MKNLKTYISLILVVVSISYSIDLHALSHSFEGSSSEDSDHCELCVINHQKEHHHFALEPQTDDFHVIALNIADGPKQLAVSQQFFIHSHYFSGQFFNRPPPFSL